MGQRHQIFIKIHNNEVADIRRQLKDKKWASNNLKGYLEKQEALERYEKAFGKGVTTVVGFYHGWLYGATALHVLRNIITMHTMGDSESTPWMKGGGNMYGYDTAWNTLMHPINSLKNIMSTLNDSTFPEGRQVNMEKFHILNMGMGGEEEQMTDCTEHDNNDGIMILDLTAKKPKYCFMALTYARSTFKNVAKMTPLTAVEYFNCYYPTRVENIERLSRKECMDDDHFASCEKLYHKEVKAVPANVKNTAIFEKMFKGLSLLTLQELELLFPKNAKQFKARKEFSLAGNQQVPLDNLLMN